MAAQRVSPILAFLLVAGSDHSPRIAPRHEIHDPAKAAKFRGQAKLAYAWRWSVEITFHDAKQHLGFEDPRGWSRKAVERTAPMAMLLYSLIVLWFVQNGHRHHRPLQLP